MNNYTTDKIRTVALVGHGGVGKTSLAEAILYRAGVIKTMGAVEKGATVCDFDAQEKLAGHSLNSSLINFDFEGVKIHLIDTPGYPDFAGQAMSALSAVDTAIIVINARNGIELMSERMMRYAKERMLCRMIVINRIDADDINLPNLIREIREKFGRECMLLELPAEHNKKIVNVLDVADASVDFDSVEHTHQELIEQLVEEDESLMAKYLEEGKEPTTEETHNAFEKAMREGHLVPIVFTSAKTTTGVGHLLKILANLSPSPLEGNPPLIFSKDKNNNSQAFTCFADANKHVIAHVFKILPDPYMGKVSIFRVFQGTIKKDTSLFVGDNKRPIKVAHLYQLQGKEFIEVDKLIAGDIGAFAKIDEIEFNSILHDSHDEDHLFIKSINFPKPMQGLAVETTKKGDEQRLFEALHKLELEDPCFVVERHQVTNETVIQGLGDMHLRFKLEKLSTQFKIELATKPPRIPYRETVTKNAEGHHRHKKQSGGAGQFGEVYLKIEPLPRSSGFEFVDQVKGGTIPSAFMPAVEKGVLQALADGVVAGYPVEDIRVIVYDGKTHPVDGKEIAFITAGKKATIAAIQAAVPIMLEPIVNIEINAPEECVGDLVGELSSRRGQISGTNPRGEGKMTINGEVPLAEIENFSSRVKSLTGGRGGYSIEFSHYAQLPMNVQQKLAGAYKIQDDDE